MIKKFNSYNEEFNFKDLFGKNKIKEEDNKIKRVPHSIDYNTATKREKELDAILQFTNGQDDGSSDDWENYENWTDEQITRLYKQIYRKEELNNNLSRSEKIEAIIEFTSKDENSADADRGDLINLNDDMLDKFYNNLFGEQTNEGVTVASPGSGTAVGGGPQGSFVSSMGVSVSGGDSGSAFSTNSSVSGMGAIVSPQPSDIPGDVRGSTKGSGDIGSRGGVYTKQPAGKKNKKKKYNRSKVASDIDKLYTTNYRETSDNGKIIQSWTKFNKK